MPKDGSRLGKQIWSIDRRLKNDGVETYAE